MLQYRLCVNDGGSEFCRSSFQKLKKKYLVLYLPACYSNIVKCLSLCMSKEKENIPQGVS